MLHCGTSVSGTDTFGDTTGESQSAAPGAPSGDLLGGMVTNFDLENLFLVDDEIEKLE